jgi:hypothetical protein
MAADSVPEAGNSRPQILPLVSNALSGHETLKFLNKKVFFRGTAEKRGV